MLNPLSRKIVFVVAIGAALTVALQLIRGIVTERQARAAEVEAGIAAGTGGRQRLLGPILVVHAREPAAPVASTAAGVPVAATPATVVRLSPVLPDALDITGDIVVTPRHRGIFRAQTFRLDGQWNGRFRLSPQFAQRAEGASASRVERVDIAFGVGDARGLRGRPEVRVGGRVLPVLSGTSSAALGDGFRAEIPADLIRPGSDLVFDVRLSLEGTGELSVVPSGDDTSLHWRSNWPHPSFEGAFLPAERAVSDAGFDATWKTTLLATNLAGRLGACLQGAANRCELPALAVRFIEPVNVYQRSERAIKYGLLFIALTFGAFFLFETLKQWRVHPLQYGFVGLALALFFLLVTSLSEHVPFVVAYGGAAGACVALITVYLRFVLGTWLRALWFGSLLAVLYAVLYGLLLSEDNALALGSLLLFGLLAAAMWITRRVDWYAVQAVPE